MPMKEAYLLVRSSSLLDEEPRATTPTVVRLDRVEGPYAAILTARGSTSEIEQLAAKVGVAARDVCWLAGTGSKESTNNVSEK